MKDEKGASGEKLPRRATPDPPDRDARVNELLARIAMYGNDPEAPVREVMSMLGDKWSPLILLVLHCGTFRHAELSRTITKAPGSGAISQRMLTLRLRALERSGLVARHVLPEVPPRVNYSLTGMGKELADLFVNTLAFLEARTPEICRAQVAFDNEHRSPEDE